MHKGSRSQESEAVVLGIEYPRPANLLTPGPIIFLVSPIVAGGAFYWAFPGLHTMWFTMGVLLFFILCLGLLVQAYRNTTGYVRLVINGDGLTVQEEPGRVRCIALAKIKQLFPARKSDPYGQETELGWITVVDDEEHIYRIPENRKFNLPYLQAEGLAKQALEALREQKKRQGIT